MDKYGISIDSKVIVKRNAKDIPIPITEVIKGDLIKGYSKNDLQDCYNIILDINHFSLDKSEYLQLWHISKDEHLYKIICGIGQELDNYNYEADLWDYKKASDLMSTNIIKGYPNDNKISHIVKDESKYENSNFMMFIMSHAANFYVRDIFDSEKENNWILVRGLKS